MSSNQALRLRALVRAAELCGGAKPLADHLGITARGMRAMLAGLTDVPEGVFLRVVDVLIARHLNELSQRLSGRRKEESSSP
jgi:hypothetical protein